MIKIILSVCISQLSDTLRLMGVQMCRRPYVIFQLCMLSLSALIVPVHISAMPKSPQASRDNQPGGVLCSFSGASDECVYEGHVFSKF